jgi:hypothetical protein
MEECNQLMLAGSTINATISPGGLDCWFGDSTAATVPLVHEALPSPRIIATNSVFSTADNAFCNTVSGTLNNTTMRVRFDTATVFDGITAMSPFANSTMDLSTYEGSLLLCDPSKFLACYLGNPVNLRRIRHLVDVRAQ